MVSDEARVFRIYAEGGMTRAEAAKKAAAEPGAKLNAEQLETVLHKGWPALRRRLQTPAGAAFLQADFAAYAAQPK
jgi:hypothetical protein